MNRRPRAAIARSLRELQLLWARPPDLDAENEGTRGLGGRAVGWPLREVAAINAARIAGRTDDEIRALVAELETARKSKAAA